MYLCNISKMITIDGIVSTGNSLVILDDLYMSQFLVSSMLVRLFEYKSLISIRLPVKYFFLHYNHLSMHRY